MAIDAAGSYISSMIADHARMTVHKILAILSSFFTLAANTKASELSNLTRRC